MSDSPASVELIDYAQLEPFVEIGFEEFRDILDSMVEEAPVLLQTLITAIETGDETTGRSKAHSLRGMLLNFGCNAMAVLLSGVERAPVFPGGDPAEIVSVLQTLWQRTRAELLDWAAAQGGSA